MKLGLHLMKSDKLKHCMIAGLIAFIAVTGVSAAPVTPITDKTMIQELSEVSSSSTRKGLVMVIDVQDEDLLDVTYDDGSNLRVKMQSVLGEAKYQGMDATFVEIRDEGETVSDILDIYGDGANRFTKNEYNALANEKLREFVNNGEYTDVFVMGHEGNWCVKCTIAGGDPVGPFAASNPNVKLGGYPHGLLDNESVTVHMSVNTTATVKNPNAAGVEDAYGGGLYVEEHPRLKLYSDAGDISPNAMNQLMANSNCD